MLLGEEKRSQVRAILANSAYVESDEGIKQQRQRIQDIEEHFNEMIDSIINPEPEPDMTSPFMTASTRSLERVYWEMRAPRVK